MNISFKHLLNAVKQSKEFFLKSFSKHPNFILDVTLHTETK